MEYDAHDFRLDPPKCCLLLLDLNWLIAIDVEGFLGKYHNSCHTFIIFALQKEGKKTEGHLKKKML